MMDPQTLDRLKQVLTQAGYRYQVVTSETEEQIERSISNHGLSRSEGYIVWQHCQHDPQKAEEMAAEIERRHRDNARWEDGR